MTDAMQHTTIDALRDKTLLTPADAGGRVSGPAILGRGRVPGRSLDSATATPGQASTHGWPMPAQLPLLQHSVCALLARGSMLVARGVGIVLLSRQLGSAQFGIYALLLVTYSISLSIGTFGLEQTNLYHVGRRPRRAAHLIGNSLLLGGGLGTAAGFLFVAAVMLLHDRIFVGASPQAVLLCALALPFGIVHNALSGLVVGLGRFKYYGAVEVLKWTAYLASIAGLYATHHLDVTIGLGCFFVIMAIGALLHLVALTIWTKARPRPSRRQLRATLRLGRNMLSVQLCHVLSLRLDVYAVRTFASSAFVGKYALASQLSEILLYLARSLALVVFSSAARSADRHALRLRRLVQAVAAATLLMCALLLAGGEKVLRLLVGDNADGALQVLLLRLPGVVTIAILLVLYGDLLGRGRSRLVLQGNALGVVLLATLAWPLAAWNPTFGAALAFSLAAFAQLAWIVSKSRPSRALAVVLDRETASESQPPARRSL